MNQKDKEIVKERLKCIHNKEGFCHKINDDVSNAFAVMSNCENCKYFRKEEEA